MKIRRRLISRRWEKEKVEEFREKEKGTIEVGKLADIICIDLNHPNMRPLHDPVSQLVYATSGAEVKTVICHGRILMEDEDYKTLDAFRIYNDIERFHEKIKASIK